jgi:hypothetical protein
MKSTYRDVGYEALCFPFGGSRKKGRKPRMTIPAELRPWSSLGEVERTELMLACQPALGGEAPTCSFDRKLERMQAFLRTRGVSITEAEIRSSRRGAHA